MGKKAKECKAIAVTVLLVSSLCTECLAQQFSNNGQFIDTNTFSNANSAAFVNNANFGSGPATSFIGNPLPVPQRAPNTYAPVNPGLYAPNSLSKGYSDGGLTPGSLGSYVNQPVHGGYWSGNNQQYQQYPSQYGPGYQQYPYQQQYYPQQYGYQHTGYNAYDDDMYRSFDAKYWAGGPVQLPYPVYPPGPGYQGGYPGQGYQGGYPGHPAMYRPHPAYPYPHPAYPYHPAYPQHPPAYHPAYRKQNKGFLGGTGSSLAKGLLGAALVGVIAGKVARG